VKYQVELRPRAEKDLRNLQRQEQERIIEKLRLLAEELRGDIKRLIQFQPSYRLRVGSYRVLFEVESDKIVVTESCIGAKLIADQTMKPDLHPQIIENNGSKESVVLPYAEYVALREWIEDMEDLLELREAKRAEGNLPGRPLEEIAKELGL
jgi:mRNA interferase RelE/StbE